MALLMYVPFEDHFSTVVTLCVQLVRSLLAIDKFIVPCGNELSVNT